MCKHILFLLVGILCVTAPKVDALADDAYGFMYWMHGWRGRSPDGERLFAIQTNRFGAVFDVEKSALVGLGNLPDPQTYCDAVSDISETMQTLPDAVLRLQLVKDDRVFSCIGADLSSLKGLESPSRIIESGRFLQRFDIQGLRFACPAQNTLDCVGRLEVIAWPDRLAFLFEVAACNEAHPMTLRIKLETEADTFIGEKHFPGFLEDAPAAIHLEWHPDKPTVDPGEAITVSSRDVETQSELPVAYDVQRGWFRIDLPARHFDLAEHPEHGDQYDVVIENSADAPVLAPLLFAMKGAFSGITGMTPLLVDQHGLPTGYPVQISKNWHHIPERPKLYEGPWFHGFSYVPVKPNQEWKGRLQLIYAHWGGVPAVSHAQLCLIGWGVNQLWDQVAIGSWGETICYDPDINLNRSMIDDIRPLMVYGMGSVPETPKLWTWTNNVGGGDFLTLFGADGKRRFPSRMRTAYLKYGPNLTEVVYAGVTDDGAVEMRMTVSSPRCDDVARAYHHIRYDVVRPVAFSRLAFYQLGADNYNDHQFERLAHGNQNGLTEEWGFQSGGMVYDRAGVVCEGDGPWWFSAHRAMPNAPRGGAWANRGLIIRSWDARLGGQRADRPHAAFFGTENGIPSMNVELAPPPGLEQLQPGDFVEATLELVVIPMNADDYYGPNINLRAHLKEHANSWKPVHRLAQRNDLDVTVEHGELLRPYPVILKSDEDRTLKFSVHGGAGYVPFTIAGVHTPEKAVLTQVDKTGNAVDALTEVNRYKQVDFNACCSCYHITYNILLDTQDDAFMTRYFLFSSATK